MSRNEQLEKLVQTSDATQMLVQTREKPETREATHEPLGLLSFASQLLLTHVGTCIANARRSQASGRGDLWIAKLVRYVLFGTCDLL